MKPLFTILCCLTAAAWAQTNVPLSWSFAWSNSADQFILKTGTASGDYTNTVTVPGAQTYADIAVPYGVTNYIVCHAVYKGNVSPPSNELQFYAPWPVVKPPAPTLRIRVPLFGINRDTEPQRVLKAPKHNSISRRHNHPR